MLLITWVNRAKSYQVWEDSLTFCAVCLLKSRLASIDTVSIKWVARGVVTMYATVGTAIGTPCDRGTGWK